MRKRKTMRYVIFGALIFICAADGFSQTRRAKVAPPAASKTGNTEQGILKQLVADNQITADCVKGLGKEMQGISVAMFDLNGDGAPEYLVKLSDSAQAQCFENARATLWCYRKTKDGYARLLAVNTVNYTVDEFVPKRTRHKNYADLHLSMTQGSSVESVTYAFDGTEYRETNRRIVSIP